MPMQSAPRGRRSEIAEVMRRRVLGGVNAGTLHRNDRLPSARDLAAEFDVDPRLVLSAYRVLAREGIVDIRRRSGIYVIGGTPITGGPSVVAEGWIVETLSAGIERGVSAIRFGEWFRRCMSTRRLRVGVIALAADQLEELCGELREGYGVDAVPFAPDVLDVPTLPLELASTEFVVTEPLFAEPLRAVMDPLKKNVLVGGLRPDVDTFWHVFQMAQPLHVVLSDARTEPALKEAAGHNAPRVRTVVLARDSLSDIPGDAPVYVTRSARQRIGDATVPGIRIPTARVFDPATCGEMLKLIVAANLKTLRAPVH